MEAIKGYEIETPGEHEIVFESRSDDDRAAAASVIVTLYNYEKYIIDCLDSVCRQTATDLDLIVVDDRSRDGSVATTAEWMRSRGDRFRRVMLLRNSENRGLARTRNLAFWSATTDYVFVLDADNLIYPRCVERLTGALDRCDASFAYCYLEKFGVESGLLSDRPWDVETLRRGNYIDAMSLVRRSTWREVGGYSTDMKVNGWEDFEFWLKIADRGGRGVLVPEILARYRVHMGSMLNSETRRKESMLWEYIENKHPLVRRPIEEPERWKYDADYVRVACDRARLDRRHDGSLAIDLKGWAISRFGICRIEIEADGEVRGRARYGDRRADPRVRGESNPNGSWCGFSHRLEIESVSAIPGEIVIRAFGVSGRACELRGRTTSIDSVEAIDQPEEIRIEFAADFAESRGSKEVA